MTSSSAQTPTSAVQTSSVPDSVKDAITALRRRSIDAGQSVGANRDAEAAERFERVATAEAALLSAIASLAQDAERYRALRDEALGAKWRSDSLYIGIGKAGGDLPEKYVTTENFDANADALVASYGIRFGQWTISRTGASVPGLDWCGVHDDYDGAEDAHDRRCVVGPTVDDVQRQIREQEQYAHASHGCPFADTAERCPVGCDDTNDDTTLFI